MRKTEAGLDGLGKGQTQELKFVLELERGRKHGNKSRSGRPDNVI